MWVCSISGLGRSPGGRHGNPLQYSCWRMPMDRRARRAIVHRVKKGWTQLKWLSFPQLKWLWIQKSTMYEKESVQFSRSVVSDSLWSHELQHARPPYPSPTPRVYSKSCPLSWWCHPTISSSVVPFSSLLQSFPSSGSFQKTIVTNIWGDWLK